ncbi:MAG TPA: DUF92 domain-containing protein [Acidobacteria bacterium]|nr:DUF92 domain-containing protein [Acidobacteriota bacterium]
MDLLPRALAGFVLSGLVAVPGWRKGSLSRSGLAGAFLTGTAIYALGGPVWWGLLIVFFVAGSALSHYRTADKAEVARDFEKGGTRDLGQVLANGGMGALLAAAYGLTGLPMLFAAFLGAMATVTADTWATELGVLSRSQPRLITTGRPVPRGTSGGVSLTGTLASAAGGLLIGAAALLLIAAARLLGAPVAVAGLPWPRLVPSVLLAATLGGLAGSLFDSLLGATVQAIYYSESRHKETERAVDPDGTPNRSVRGLRWMNNDWVNFLASAAGALAAAAVWHLLR